MSEMPGTECMFDDRDDWIDELIGAQRPGFSLAQAFYRDPAIFRRDCDRVFRHHWIMAGHVSQIPERGDYLLFEVAGESIIIIRDHDASVHAHFNVCRHRGSRLLLSSEGRASAITCKYHGWSYAPDGSLRSAPRMSEDFDPSDYGLKACHLKIVEGLILINLSAAEAPDIDGIVEKLGPYLRLHGIAAAKLAKRRIFPVDANWKLALENYLECYHCRPAHKEYCRVEIKADRNADGSPAAMARYEARNSAWRARAKKLGTLPEDVGTELPLDARLADAQFGTAYRAPLRETFLTGTEDGQPVAPLMGEFREYDGGETAIGLGPFTYMLAYNDYAAFFQFVPVDNLHSNIISSWLVRGGARERDDYDLDRLTWLWNVTTAQDKSIIEANAAGIRSDRYEPGPTSLLEGDVTAFRQWYLAVSGPRSRLAGLSRLGSGHYFGI